MSIANLLNQNDQSYLNIRTNTISSGILLNTYHVPLGSLTLNITSNNSQYVCLPTETLPTVTYTLPLASSCPGMFLMIINKSTTTTINVVPQGSDIIAGNQNPLVVGPSTGPGGDYIVDIFSDGIDTWN